MFGWLFRLFRRKPPDEPTEYISDEALQQRAIWAVQMVIISSREIDPLDRYSIYDAKAAAMAIFVEDCPYLLSQKHLVRAKKAIDKLEMFLIQRKIIV